MNDRSRSIDLESHARLLSDDNLLVHIHRDVATDLTVVRIKTTKHVLLVQPTDRPLSSDSDAIQYARALINELGLMGSVLWKIGEGPIQDSPE